MIWKSHGIPCFKFYFLFRNKDKRKQLDFRRCHGNIFSRVAFWKDKELSQRLQGTLKMAFERHLIVEDFTDMDEHMSSASSQKNIAPVNLTYYCMLLLFSPKHTFWIQINVDWIIFITIYLPFKPWKFWQYHHAFFIRTSKTSIMLNVRFYEGLQLQNVIMFLFSIKHSYLLTVKTTPDVNNYL